MSCVSTTMSVGTGSRRWIGLLLSTLPDSKNTHTTISSMSTETWVQAVSSVKESAISIPEKRARPTAIAPNCIAREQASPANQQAGQPNKQAHQKAGKMANREKAHGRKPAIYQKTSKSRATSKQAEQRAGAPPNGQSRKQSNQLTPVNQVTPINQKGGVSANTGHKRPSTTHAHRQTGEITTPTYQEQKKKKTTNQKTMAKARTKTPKLQGTNGHQKR